MRKVSENKDFPFLSKSLCYYEVVDNELKDLARDEKLLKEAYERVKKGKSKLYVTWHGQYRTDMFEIDDLVSFGQTFGFEKPEHIHDIEWKCCNKDDNGAYVTIEVDFKCGCTFDGFDGIQKLKKELLLQKGWDMSASAGMGICDSKYTIKVLKNSIK